MKKLLLLVGVFSCLYVCASPVEAGGVSGPTKKPPLVPPLNLSFLQQTLEKASHIQPVTCSVGSKESLYKKALSKSYSCPGGIEYSYTETSITAPPSSPSLDEDTYTDRTSSDCTDHLLETTSPFRASNSSFLLSSSFASSDSSMAWKDEDTESIEKLMIRSFVAE